MALPDTLSCFKPKPGLEIALDIAINHACLSPVQKDTLQLAFEIDVEMHALADIIISGWLIHTKEVPCPLQPFWQHHVSLTVEDGLVFHGEASSSLHQKGRRSLVLCTNHIKALPKHSCLPVEAIEEAVWQCETYMRFQVQDAATPLMPTPTPSCPWQICASDIFTSECMDYLILADFYSKVSWYVTSLQAKVTLPKSSTSWKNGFVIMAHQRFYAQIMAHSMLVLPLQIGALNEVSPMKHPVHTTQSPIDLQSHVSK